MLTAAYAMLAVTLKGASTVMSLEAHQIGGGYEIPVRLRNTLQAPRRRYGVDAAIVAALSPHIGMQECGVAMLALLAGHRSPHDGQSLEEQQLRGVFRKLLIEDRIWLEICEINSRGNEQIEVAVAATAMYLCAAFSVLKRDQLEEQADATSYPPRPPPQSRSCDNFARMQSQSGPSGNEECWMPELSDQVEMMHYVIALLSAEQSIARCCAAAALWCLCRHPGLRSRCAATAPIALLRALRTSWKHICVHGETSSFCPESSVIEWVLGVLYVLTEEKGVVKELASAEETE
ncbi:hypothetical protein CYMTET_23281, partial [Cymbomonas tetramitiformis]